MKTVLLGDICNIVSGYGFPKRVQGRSDGRYPFLKVSDMNLPGNKTYIYNWNNTLTKEVLSEIKVKTYPVNTIIFPKIGAAIATNKKRILTTESAFDNNVMGLVPDTSKVDVSYLYHWISAFDLSNWASKSELPSMRKSEVEVEPLMLPPIEDQRLIVKKLDEAFEKIDKAVELTQKNLQNSRELFDSKIANTYEEPSRDWKINKLFEVSKLDKKSYNPKDELPFVGMEDIGSGDAKFMGSLEPKKMQARTFVFDRRHILYGRLRPYLNKVIAPNFSGHCSTEIFPILPNDDELERYYLLYWFLNWANVRRIEATSTGTRMPRANMDIVMDFEIALPEISEQRKIADELNELHSKTQKLQKLYQHKLDNLHELKKSLLDKAFKGEL